MIASVSERIKRIQSELDVTADGIIGPATLASLEARLGINTTLGIPSQLQVRAGTSIYGKPGHEDYLVNIEPPYPLYYDGRPVKTIRVHRLISDRVLAALRDVLDHYGLDDIKRLGLDQYSGSYNYRPTVGGKSMSMHAWGIALDWDAEHNAYATRAPKARLSGSAYEAWWQAWERQGAVSLGRARDCDWMHLQFATL